MFFYLLCGDRVRLLRARHKNNSVCLVNMSLYDIGRSLSHIIMIYKQQMRDRTLLEQAVMTKIICSFFYN